MKSLLRILFLCLFSLLALATSALWLRGHLAMDTFQSVEAVHTRSRKSITSFNLVAVESAPGALTFLRARIYPDSKLASSGFGNSIRFDAPRWSHDPVRPAFKTPQPDGWRALGFAYSGQAAAPGITCMLIDSTSLTIPLWFPFLLFAFPAFLLFRAHRRHNRRRRAGRGFPVAAAPSLAEPPQ